MHSPHVESTQQTRLFEIKKERKKFKNGAYHYICSGGKANMKFSLVAIKKA